MRWEFYMTVIVILLFIYFFTWLWRKLLAVINFVTVSIIVIRSALSTLRFDSCDVAFEAILSLLAEGHKFYFNLFIPAVEVYLRIRQYFILITLSSQMGSKATKEIQISKKARNEWEMRRNICEIFLLFLFLAVYEFINFFPIDSLSWDDLIWEILFWCTQLGS